MTGPVAPRHPATTTLTSDAAVSTAPPRTAVLQRTTPVTVRALSEPMTALLRDGTGLDRYASRSEAVMATAVAAVNAGWDEETWRLALEGACEEIAAWAATQIRQGRSRQRSAGDAERHLSTTWRNAVARVAERPPTGDHFTVQAELAEIDLTISAHPHLWGKASGPSDRAVLQVLLAIAREACTLTPSASTRQVSEHANVSPTTVTNALRRLAKAGWVRQDSPAQGTLAPTWRLLRPEDLPAPAPEVAAVLENLPVLPLAAALGRTSVRAHDAFSHSIHGGLGRIAARLVDLLDPTGAQRLTAAQLQALSGLHRRTVTKHVRALALAGLVEVDHRGVRRVLETDAAAAAEHLDDVAGELGSTGVVARRKARHAAQREAFTLWRVDFDARRGWRVERGLYRPEQPQLFAGPPRARVPSQRAA
ncbi:MULTISPECIES: winged helix-turn-helix transcriptional regulator [Actinomycetes]|uniref:Winged helix-turn-helix transcriptional regulator n=1 Tax=Quadrisphaera setariae TaxID=2593304 RepID=A0A5C8Z645_9ACTN|nr:MULTISPECIES: winged helix-turn-helix transcriptional regulator [Actinomycetes]TNM60462.1 winged helix-turn-helix transcriptional regulator [Streptomyces sp. NP160]TXR52396.1 winged helix-turn-helix transcriptional regulator [Quadrisphaera setariae]